MSDQLGLANVKQKPLALDNVKQKPAELPNAKKEPAENLHKNKLKRCMEWLQEQNALQNQTENHNDFHLIFEAETDEREYQNEDQEMLSVPAGVNEEDIKPKKVPLNRLRVDELRLECEWQYCYFVTSNYEQYQKHVASHIPGMHIVNADDKLNYVCLWDICGHKCEDRNEMVRHIHYHSYHSKLMAIGFNARATLNLQRCKRDSSKRNILPALKYDYACMWIDCNYTCQSVQTFLDHLCCHANHVDEFMCSWAGCGVKCHRRMVLKIHIRSHTGERLIACYHCGTHFSRNGKLVDHLLRQNTSADSGLICGACGATCASPYLLREHARQHVSLYACGWCDMSAPSPAALARHVLYRHVATQRRHPCDQPNCHYSAITKWDLKKHLQTHVKKNKANEDRNSDADSWSDLDYIVKKKKPVKKQYCCHMCPSTKPKIFCTGYKLTMHLVKIHGIQWPFGHSRFRYQISEDGMYRVTTTRLESLEVSKQIMDRETPNQLPQNYLDIEITEESKATYSKPRTYSIAFKEEQQIQTSPKIEITVCDVDEFGNVLNSKVVTDTPLNTLDIKSE